MPQWKLYHIWMTKLEELRPGERVTRLRNFTWLLVGLYCAQAVHLSKVAAKMPGLSYLPSRIRRLSRLPPSRGRGEVDNPAIQVRAWYPVQSTLDCANQLRAGYCNGWPVASCISSWMGAKSVLGTSY